MKEVTIYAASLNFGNTKATVESVVAIETPKMFRTANGQSAGYGFGFRSNIPKSEAFLTPGEAIDAKIAALNQVIESHTQRIEDIKQSISHLEALKAAQ